MSSEIEALNDIKGRCLFLKIQYPDTHVRVDPAIDLVNKSLNEAIKRPLYKKEVDDLSEELYDLRNYLLEIEGKYPEVKKDFTPLVKTINWLLSTDEAKR